MGDIISNPRYRISYTNLFRGTHAQPADLPGIKALLYRAGKMINEYIISLSSGLREYRIHWGEYTGNNNCFNVKYGFCCIDLQW